MSDTLKFLKKEVKRTKGVEVGTVVMFDRFISTRYDEMRRETMPLSDDEVKVITYAAIFRNDRWYFTGKGRLGNTTMTTREFLDRMAESDISNIRLATAFERIDDDDALWDA